MSKLPIEVIPNSNPPRFRWKRRVSTPNGVVEQVHEGTLPLGVDHAVSHLIAEVKRLQDRVVELGLKLVEAKNPQQSSPTPKRVK